MTAIIINNNSEKLVRGRSYCSVGFDKCLIQMSILVEKKNLSLYWMDHSFHGHDIKSIRVFDGQVLKTDVVWLSNGFSSMDLKSHHNYFSKFSMYKSSKFRECDAFFMFADPHPDQGLYLRQGEISSNLLKHLNLMRKFVNPQYPQNL